MNAGKKGPKLPRVTSFGWLVAVLGSELAQSLDNKLRAKGLSLSLWPTLFALWEEDGLTQTELTIRCSTAHYTTTRVLDTLETKGLVERRPHPESRRAHLVYLTKEGKKIEEELTGEAIQTNEEFLAPLSADEQAHLKSLIFKIISERLPDVGRS